MNGIVIDIDPVLLRLGHFELRWYGVILLVAIATAVWLAARQSPKKGIPSEEIYSLVPWLLIGGIIGARLFHVVDQWQHYAANPLQILMLQQGGLAIWGGLAGGSAATVVFARVRRIPLGRLADTLVLPVLVAQIIGRFACIINGDAYGGVTGLPWGFIYIHPGAMIPNNLMGVPTHPYPVYEMIWNGLVLLALLRLRRHFPADGLLFLSYLPLYALGRFLLTFVRQENTTLWGLQQAQVVALAMLVVSVALFIYFYWKARHNVAVESGTQVSN